MNMASNARTKQCEFCEEQTASHFCSCANPPALFCMDCCHYHKAQSCSDPHQILSVSTLGMSLEAYMQKKEAIAEGAAALRKNLKLIDEFCREFDDMVRKCISDLTEYRSKWLQRMQAEKEELRASIEAAVQETTDSLDQGLVVMSPLAQAVWTLSCEELQLVSYSVMPPDVQTLCQTWASYQNQLQSLCMPFSFQVPRDVFASVWCNTVEVYNLKSRQSTNHTLSVDFGHGGSYIQVDRHTLMCLGADPASSEVYDLDLFSHELTALPPLLASRGFAGVAKVAQFVYVFGGRNSAKRLKSCEKYDLQGREWQPLSSMQERRSYFTPCLFRSLIYLPCPVTPLIEAFCPETEVFTVLSVCLPSQLDYGSVSFVAKGELCILTDDGQMGQWKIESEGEFRVSGTDRECWSAQPPMILDSVVFIANEGKIEKWSLESSAFL